MVSDQNKTVFKTITPDFFRINLLDLLCYLATRDELSSEGFGLYIMLSLVIIVVDKRRLFTFSNGFNFFHGDWLDATENISGCFFWCL